MDPVVGKKLKSVFTKKNKGILDKLFLDSYCHYGHP